MNPRPDVACGAAVSPNDSLRRQGGEPREAVEIAADAKAAIADEIPRASKNGTPDNSTGSRSPPSAGQLSAMPLQVSRVATACITRPSDRARRSRRSRSRPAESR